MKIATFSSVILLLSLCTFYSTQEAKANRFKSGVQITEKTIEVIRKLSKNEALIKVKNNPFGTVKQGVDTATTVASGYAIYVNCNNGVISHKTRLIEKDDQKNLFFAACRKISTPTKKTNTNIKLTQPLFVNPSAIKLYDKSKTRLPVTDWSNLDWSKKDTLKIDLTKVKPLR